MTAAAPVRHLVLSASVDGPPGGLVTTFCTEDQFKPVPYDRSRHTYLTALATCPDCLVVHAAWHTAFVASLC